MRSWLSALSGMALLLVVMFSLALPASMAAEEAMASNNHFTQASWYGPGFYGHVRADGRRYEKNEVFVASVNLPIGEKLRVMNLKNHRSLIVTVCDRMPFRRHTKRRELDLSRAAAAFLGVDSSSGPGVIPVMYEVLE